MFIQFFRLISAVTSYHLAPIMLSERLQSLLTYVVPIVFGAVIFLSEHGSKVEIYKLQTLIHKHRSEAIVISVYAAAGGCIFRYHSDRAFSGLLTLAAAVQSLGLALLLVAVRRGARGVSRGATTLMALALSCRLYCSARYNGYLPTDRSGDGPLQTIDAVSLCICFVLVIAHQRDTEDTSVHRMKTSVERARACPKAPSPRSRAPRMDNLAASTDSHRVLGPAFPTLWTDVGGDMSESDGTGAELSEVPFPGVPAHALAAVCAVLAVVVHPNLVRDFAGDSVWAAGQYFECAAVLPQLQMAARSGSEPWHASFLGLILLARVTAFPFWVAVRPELDRIGGRAFNVSGSMIILAHFLQLSSIVLFAAIGRCRRSSNLGFRSEVEDFVLIDSES